MKSQLTLALTTALAFTVAGCSKTDSTEVAETVTEAPTETAMTTNPAERNPFFSRRPSLTEPTPKDLVELAGRVLEIESRAVLQLKYRLYESFATASQL